MKSVSHESAKPSHYNLGAKDYDAFNEQQSAIINKTLEALLKKHNVKTVLDLTCGTGSQVFWLAQRGFHVVGSDINANMLKVARAKEREKKLGIKFIKGDMRTTKAGTFDAVITIFNSVGHLTKNDFEKAIQNVHANLKDGGLYIFDIFNLSYLLKGDTITQLTIDWQKISGNKKIRDVQYSTIDDEGVLASYTIHHIQEKTEKPKITRSTHTLQVYTVQQLKSMLQAQGFKVVRQCGIDGTRFSNTKTERILTIAKKQ